MGAALAYATWLDLGAVMWIESPDEPMDAMCPTLGVGRHMARTVKQVRYETCCGGQANRIVRDEGRLPPPGVEVIRSVD